MMSVLLSEIALAVTVVGILRRTGGLRGWLPVTTLTFLGLGLLVSFLTTWAWPLWGALLTVVALGIVLRLRASEVAVAVETRASDWLMVAAWPVGFGLSVLFTQIKVGPLDEYGDYPLGAGFGFGVGAALFSMSLIQIGRWLLTEEPATTEKLVAV